MTTKLNPVTPLEKNVARWANALAALRAERDELLTLLAAALDDNYWHAEGCGGDKACICWVSKSRAVLAKYAGKEE